MSDLDYSTASALVANPVTDAATLARVAAAFPALHAAIRMHPNVYPDLVAWMDATAPAAPARPSAFARVWANHRAALLAGGGVLALIIVIVVIGGIVISQLPAATPEAAPATTRSAQSDEPAEESEPEPEVVLEPVTLPDDRDWIVVGNLIVGASDGFNMTGSIWTPALGVQVYDATDLVTDGTIQEQAVFFSGTPDAYVVASVVSVLVPADGLTPASGYRALLFIDPISHELISRVDIDSGAEGYYYNLDSRAEVSVSETTGGVVAIAMPQTGIDTATQTLDVIGFDGTTGSEVWRTSYVSDSNDAELDSRAIAGFIEVHSAVPNAPSQPDGEACGAITILDAQTGEATWTKSESVGDYGCSIGGDVIPYNVGPSSSASIIGTGAIMNIANEFSPELGFLSMSSGKPAYYYQYLDLAHSLGVKYVDGDLISVDTSTGSDLATIPAATVEQLDLYVKSVYDGLLYTETSTESPVVDAATGETVRNVADRYPLGGSGGWTLLSDNTVVPDWDGRVG